MAHGTHCDVSDTVSVQIAEGSDRATEEVAIAKVIHETADARADSASRQHVAGQGLRHQGHGSSKQADSEKRQGTGDATGNRHDVSLHWMIREVWDRRRERMAARSDATPALSSTQSEYGLKEFLETL
ncbi:MAG: hypothetical protein ACT4PU_08645 [Planctomycetota bacterium]